MGARQWRVRAFGELREVLHGAPDPLAWSKLLALFAHIERGGDEDWIAQEILPYAEQQLERWPDAVRQVRWGVDEVPGALTLELGRWLRWEMDPRGQEASRQALRAFWETEAFSRYSGILWARVPPLEVLQARGGAAFGYPWVGLPERPGLVHLGLECATPGNPWTEDGEAVAPDVEDWLESISGTPESLWLGSYYMRQNEAHLEGGLRALARHGERIAGVKDLSVFVGVGPRTLDAALALLEAPLMEGVERLSLLGTRAAETAALCRALWERSWPRLASVRLDEVSRRDAEAWREVRPRVELVTVGGEAPWGVSGRRR